MRGFYGKDGKFYSDAQRRAMFAGQSIPSAPRLVYRADVEDPENKFAIGLALPLVALPVAAGVGASLAPAAIGAGAVGAGALGGLTGPLGGTASSLGGSAISGGFTELNKTISEPAYEKIPHRYDDPRFSNGITYEMGAEPGIDVVDVNPPIEFINPDVTKSAAQETQKLMEGATHLIPENFLQTASTNVATGMGQQMGHDVGSMIGKVAMAPITLPIKAGKRIGGTAQYMVAEPIKAGRYVAGEAIVTGMGAAQPMINTAGALIGEGAGELISEIGEPAMPQLSVMMTSNTDAMGLPIMSRSPNVDINVNVLRNIVKKQYPGADVDADVIVLPPEKYMERALKDNPGRESEALISNGFYSPVKDTAYLEMDKKNPLNTVRATLHELIHDMSDDGVDDGSHKKYMLNEGYADYVSKKLMTQEMGLPKNVVNRTLGYPGEVKQVEGLVNKFGRKEVDKAFLKYHSLDHLDAKGPLLVGDAS